jgi:hypothetical protein
MKDSEKNNNGEMQVSSRSLKTGCKGVKESHDIDGQGVNMGLLGCKSDNEAKEPLNKSGIGINPLKYALPLRVEFLKPCDRFVGENLHKLGEVTNYGPYQAGDAATLPKLHATTLILKGVAVEAGVDSGSKEVRWT